MKLRKYTPFLLVAIALIIAAFIELYTQQRMTSDAQRIDKPIEDVDVPSGDLQRAALGVANPSPEEALCSLEQKGEFSPQMQRLVDGIRAGYPVVVSVGESKDTYLFRPKKVTTEKFQISVSSNAKFSAAYEVFEGRRISDDGTLREGGAALAVVNDTVSMAYTTAEGDFLIERDESGHMVQVQLSSSEPESLLGTFTCAQDGPTSGSIDASGGMPLPLTTDVNIELGGEFDANDPNTSGAIASHPYFRLGSQYDASLKDLNVLMISGSTQTGASSNFSSRAASYFTYAATLKDVYERQLGLRYQLQELILIADDPGLSPADDVEYDDSVTPNDTGSATDDLLAVKAWVDSNRPQATYDWGHVMAWTLVNSDTRNTVGWAYNSGYGSSDRAFTVNEREMTWGIIVHEMGHNIGANHTSGGAMNAIVSKSNPKEDFFTENASTGGFTAATQIYDYMSDPARAYITGPADLRNPMQMPFGVDDAVSTAADTPVRFDPLANDLAATPLFGATNRLRLVEVGQIFPKAAGTAFVSGNEIIFVPASGVTGNVWFSYTLSGDVGNNNIGWMHSADVIVTVGGDSSDPNQSPALSTTEDVVETDFSGDIRINPLLNDEGDGRFWVGDVDGIGMINGVAQAGDYSDGAFHLVSATVTTGNGTVALEELEVTRNGSSVKDKTGYLVYTPGGSEPSQVVIEYTVEDENGNQSTGNIYLDFSESVSASSDLSKLVEREGRVATITVSRSGSTTDSEWVGFLISGSVDLFGSGSDVALSGYDTFDPASGTGRLTIPAGQSSANVVVSAMEDTVEEGAESLVFNIIQLENLVVESGQGTAAIDILEESPIETVLLSQNFDSFPDGTGLSAGWTVDSAQPGVWTATSGQTPTQGSGPLNDHTQSDASGKYLYREASGGNTNQRADLLSPVIDLFDVNKAALEFYYHMYDATTDDMGELRVDVFSNGSWHLDVMTPLIGEQQLGQSDPWGKIRIDISQYATVDFRARFRGITGVASRSDMAIDDFLVGELFSDIKSPVILGQPQSKPVVADDSVYLSVVARAYPSPTYQWKKDGVILSGETQSVLYLESFEAGDEGDYTCEVTSGTTTTSSTASLSLVDADDVDTDFISDTWELVYFKSTSVTDGTGDFDGDGLLDFFEYIFGTKPDDANGTNSSYSVGPAGNGTDMVFKWEVKEGIILGEDYLVEISTSLMPWTEVPEEDYTINTTTESGRVCVELSIPQSYADRVFLRLARP